VPTAPGITGPYEVACVILVFPVLLMMGARITTMAGPLGRLCRFTGQLSYPLYIVHYPLIYMFGHWVWNTKPGIATMQLAAAGLFATEIALGTALLYAYDLPVRAWLTKKFIKAA